MTNLQNTTALTPPTTGTNILQSHVMLVELNISCCGFERKDITISNKVNKEHGTSNRASKLVKHVFDPKDTDGPQKIARSSRETHMRLTLSSPFGKTRMLPVTMYDKYCQAMDEHKIKFDLSVAELIKEIPQLKERARIDLNGMFKESDYSFIDSIQDRYSFKRLITPVPSGGNFIADLVDSEIETIKADIEQTNKAMVENAMQDSFFKLHEKVKKIADALDGYTVERVRKAGGKWKNEPSRKLFDSMLTRLADLVEVLPDLNITNDPTLDGLINEIKASDILKHDIATFKQPANAAIVKTVQSEASDIADKMVGFFGPTNEVN